MPSDTTITPVAGATPSTNWPPPSFFGTDVLEVCSLTESMEAVGSVDAITLQIQMAALLFLGDTVACRHLWRRHTNSNQTLRQTLEPWKNVAAAMHAHDGAALWPALSELEKKQEEHFPIAQYAQDIAQAHRLRILRPYVTGNNKGLTPPSFLLPLLGFSSMQEVESFCQQSLANSSMAPSGDSLSATDRAALVAFLQAQLAL